MLPFTVTWAKAAPWEQAAELQEIKRSFLFKSFPQLGEWQQFLFVAWECMKTNRENLYP